jgi:hypothetical protein
MTPRDRYRGKPILLIIEHYVLVVIDELSVEDTAEIGSGVRAIWGGGPDWVETVRRELALNASFDEAITRNWAGFCALAREQGTDEDPFEFARGFADEVERQTQSSQRRDHATTISRRRWCSRTARPARNLDRVASLSIEVSGDADRQAVGRELGIRIGVVGIRFRARKLCGSTEPDVGERPSHEREAGER